MTYPGRRPDLDPAEDPARPVYPGAIERDLSDPAVPDPRMEPVASARPRGIASAAIMVAIVLLAVLAFSFMGGGTTDQAITPGAGQIEGTENPSTGSIPPSDTGAGEATIPPIQPNNPSQPVEPAPAN